MEAALDVRAAALAAVYEPIDAALAVWRGLILIGHRRSIEAGLMFWALPGRGFADGITLKMHDSEFRVIFAPTTEHLVNVQPILRELAG